MYHWILTLSRPNGQGGYANATLDGTATIDSGASRQAVLAQLRENCIERIRADAAPGQLDRAPVEFFQLAPDTL